MMAGVNKVILIGHVGRDAEVRYTQSGTAVANFSLATSESFPTETGTGRVDKTEWHNIVVWAKQAEIAGQYVRKGRQLYIEGRLQTRDWVDPQGVKHYKTEVVCNRFQFLGKKDDDAQTDSAQDDDDLGDLGPPLEMDGLTPGN